jgi:hypothetical protein
MQGDPWRLLVDEIAVDCRSVGSWEGEARLLRDAHGATRLGPRVAERIAAKLAEAGYEISESPRYESDGVIVTPAGTTALAATVEALLPDLRAFDAAMGDPPWKDALVASRAVGRWLSRRMPTDARAD